MNLIEKMKQEIKRATAEASGTAPVASSGTELGKNAAAFFLNMEEFGVTGVKTPDGTEEKTG